MFLADAQLGSDAVKIGFPILGTLLGAVIGGISTYSMGRLNFKNDLKKEQLKKRQELVFQIVMQVSEFEHLAGRYAASVASVTRGLKSHLDFETCRDEITKETHTLRKARATLRLLDLDAEYTLLEDYVELTREVVRYGETLPAARAAELSDQIARGPERFYSSISKQFKVGL